jgi:quinol monooxygenase YgiN
MGDAIQITATFPAIEKSNLDAFKRGVATAIEGSRQEPGTVQYDWFSTEDESAFLVREKFECSEAFLSHVEDATDTLAQLVELGGGLKLEIFGSPTAELLEAVADAGPIVYSFVEGK